MEIVKDENLKRYAVIDLMDIIAYDSNDVTEAYSFFCLFGKYDTFRGVYDYKQNMYLDEVDIIDITGVQI